MATDGVIGIRDTTQYSKVVYIPHDFDLAEAILLLLKGNYKSLDELYEDILEDEYVTHNSNVPPDVDYEVAVYEVKPGVIILGGFTLTKDKLYKLLKLAKESGFKRLLIKPVKYNGKLFKGESVYIIEYQL